jgi:hypothetical protein
MTRYSFLMFLALLVFTASGQTKSKKRGIAYGHLSEADLAAISPGLSWWYNWSETPENTVAGVYQKYNMDFVPMTWNNAFNETALRAFYSAHPEAKFLLAFNEPNFTTQANMTPSQVAAAWPRLEQVAKDYGLQIVGPAVNYCDKCITENGVTFTTPVQYLDAFFAVCPNCKVDYIAVHNYMCYSGALSSYIDLFKKYGRKIWLTEFACWDQPNITLDMQKSYILGSLDYLENDTLVYRYAWFTGDRSGSYPYLDLFKSSPGELTDLGKLYVSYYPVHDTSLYTTIPARIEAENYTTMYGIALEGVNDIDGVADVGWIDAYDWLSYNIDVPHSGDYYVYCRISANSSSNFQVLDNGQVLTVTNIPATGGYQSWRTFDCGKITLSKGKHKLRLTTNTGGFNINWLEITDTPKNLTGLNDPAKSGLSLYPNPVSDKLFIRMPGNHSRITARLVDQTGRKILEEQYPGDNDLVQLDLSTVSDGLYILQVISQDALVSKVVIKAASH